MPLNADGWTDAEDRGLARLVEPHKILYNLQDTSRSNIVFRETIWQEIGLALSKPVEECKKRWRTIRDSYVRALRCGSTQTRNSALFKELDFLDATMKEERRETIEELILGMDGSNDRDAEMTTMEEQVITDNQEYYEITVVDGTPTQEQPPSLVKILPKPPAPQKKNAKIGIPRIGRKRNLTPVVTNSVAPIKILPKPVIVNGPKLVRYVEEQKSPEQRSQMIDKLIEKVLKENTNEIDVFFRSMAASVKKLQPNLIPKVKMEVCNVIAKYEMQSIDKKF